MNKMSQPKRHRKTWSLSTLSTIIVTVPIVSGVSLQELGLGFPAPASAGKACRKAYRAEIPGCTVNDFVNGCTKACRAGVAEATDDFSLACEGLFLGKFLEPFFSAAGEAILCGESFSSSSNGQGSTATVSSTVAPSVLPSASEESSPTTAYASASASSPASSIVSPVPITSTLMASTAATPLFANTSSLDPLISIASSMTSVISESPISTPSTSLPASNSNLITIPFVIPASTSQLPAALTSLVSPAAASIAAASESQILSFLSSMVAPSASQTVSSTFTTSLLSSTISLNAGTTAQLSETGASPTPTFIFPFPAASSSTASALPMESNSTDPTTASLRPIPSANTTMISKTSSIHTPLSPTTTSSRTAGSGTQSSDPSKTSATGVAVSSSMGNVSQTTPADERTTTPNAGIIGGVLGGSIAFAVLTTTLFYYCLRRNRQIEGQRHSSWDFIDGPRRRVASNASLMSLPPMGYFEQPSMIPREARIARSSGTGRYPSHAQGASSQFSSLVGNYQHSDTARDPEMMYGSGPPASSVLRNNPSPIQEERDSIAFFNQGRGRAFG